jgi:hypothetical protein
MVAFWGAVLFIMFGLCTEIVFTGISSWWDESFLGHVSLLMVPVYATVYAAIGPLLSGLERLGWTRAAIRIPLTVVAIYAFEWGFGALYAALGLAPWHYEHGWASDFSGGHVTLYYLPAWIAFAAIVVPVWRRIHALAPEIVRVASAKG